MNTTSLELVLQTVHYVGPTYEMRLFPQRLVFGTETVRNSH